MEEEFRALVAGNNNFNRVTLETFSAIPEEYIKLYFDTSTIAGLDFMGSVMALRKRFNQQSGNLIILCSLYLY